VEFNEQQIDQILEFLRCIKCNTANSSSTTPLPPTPEFDSVLLCDPLNGNTVIVTVKYDASGIPTAKYFNLDGSVYTGATPIKCSAGTSLESDAITICISGTTNATQWVVKDGGQPTGVVYYTDTSGVVIPTPIAFTSGACQITNTKLTGALEPDYCTGNIGGYIDADLKVVLIGSENPINVNARLCTNTNESTISFEFCDGFNTHTAIAEKSYNTVNGVEISGWAITASTYPSGILVPTTSLPPNVKMGKCGDVQIGEWQPFCLDGNQWYRRSTYKFINDGSSVNISTPFTEYKQGVDGSITTSAPTGTTKTDGYCNSGLIITQPLPICICDNGIGTTWYERTKFNSYGVMNIDTPILEYSKDLLMWQPNQPTGLRTEGYCPLASTTFSDVRLACSDIGGVQTQIYLREKTTRDSCGNEVIITEFQDISSSNGSPWSNISNLGGIITNGECNSCNPVVHNGDGGSFSSFPPSHSFIFFKPINDDVLITTSFGILRIPPGVTTYSTDTFDCPFTLTNVISSGNPLDVIINSNKIK
jgi:hypothetical protein